MPSLADRWRWAAVIIVGGCSAAAGAQDLDLVNATLVEGTGAAVRAGVRSIEHGTWIDEATLEEMSRLGNGMVVVGGYGL